MQLIPLPFINREEGIKLNIATTRVHAPHILYSPRRPIDTRVDEKENKSSSTQTEYEMEENTFFLEEKFRLI